MADPVPPLNVRHVLADGSEQPVQVVYDGQECVEGDWLHVWTVVEPTPPGFVGLHVDMIPASTSVRVAVPDDWRPTS